MPDREMIGTLIACNAIVIFRDVMSGDERIVSENPSDSPAALDEFNRQGGGPLVDALTRVFEGDGEGDCRRLMHAIRRAARRPGGTGLA